MEQKSLRQLAKELGVSASYLSQVNHGKRPLSEKVAEVLSKSGLDVKQFVKQDGHKIAENPITNRLRYRCATRASLAKSSSRNSTEGGTRTRMDLSPTDFKSVASSIPPPRQGDERTRTAE